MGPATEGCGKADDGTCSGDVLELGICAVDADEVGGVCGGGSDLDEARICTAVRGLQSVGMNVILVSQHNLSHISKDPPVWLDSQRLLHIQALNETAVDLLRVADEYRCPFITNKDVEIMASSDWRIPWRRQIWLQRVTPQLHIQFAFNEQGVFGAKFPRKVKEHLTPRASHLQAATIPCSQEAVSKPPHGPCKAATPASSAAWLGGMEQQAGADEEVQEAGGSEWPIPARATQLSEPPPPPASGPSASQSTKRRQDDSITPIEGSGWLFDNEWPPFALLQEGWGGKSVFFLECADKSTWLFPHAMELVGSVVPCDHIQDLEADDDGILPDRLMVKGCPFQVDPTLYTIVKVLGGRYDGMRAVGLGSNAKARKRAARLALLATVRAMHRSGQIEDPTGDSAFFTLAQRAARLSGDVDLEQMCVPPNTGRDDPPPPPPPGVVHWRSQSPPPPPAGKSSGSPASTEDELENLRGKHCVALAGYNAEGTGYLALRPGDRLRIGHDKAEAPGEKDKFSWYVYGAQTGARQQEEAGWFPLDLVQLE